MKHTTTGTFCWVAKCLARSMAQLSSTRWSRTIQYTTHLPSACGFVQLVVSVRSRPGVNQSGNFIGAESPALGFLVGPGVLSSTAPLRFFAALMGVITRGLVRLRIKVVVHVLVQPTPFDRGRNGDQALVRKRVPSKMVATATLRNWQERRRLEPPIVAELR